MPHPLPRHGAMFGVRPSVFLGVVASLCMLLSGVTFLTADAADAAADGAGVALAVTPDDLDWSASRAWAGDFLAAAPPQDGVLAALGLGPAAGGWSTGPRPDQRREFVLTFTHPVAIGTLICDFADTTRRVSTLKPGVTGVPDPLDEAQWDELPARSVRTLPVGFTTRALRLSHRYSNLPWDFGQPATGFPALLLLRERFYSPLDFGNEARGRVTWEAKRKVGEAETDCTLDYWPMPLGIDAVALLAAPRVGARVESLAVSEQGHPQSAADASWQALAVAPETPWRSAGPGVARFATPVTTRALRLLGSGYKVGQYDPPPSVLPLIALGAAAVPDGFLPAAPLNVRLPLSEDSFAAVRVRDAQGRDVRRLSAEILHRGSDAVVPWDLRDDRGREVPPGDYTWSAVTRPPLALTYETTVYNAGAPPWNAPIAGGGGWMADHSPPLAVTSVGGVMFFAAMGAEFGYGLIATNPDGVKLRSYWGEDHATHLVSDGDYAYSVNAGNIIRYDPRTWEKRSILGFGYSPEVPPPNTTWPENASTSAALYGKHLYIAAQGAPPPWIESSPKVGDFDLPGSFPTFTNAVTHDTEYTLFERVYGAFLAITSSQQASFGTALADGPMAHTLMLKFRRPVPVGSIVVPAGLQIYALREGKPLPDLFDTRRVVGDATLLGEGGGPAADLAMGLGELDARFIDTDTWQALTPTPLAVGAKGAEGGLVLVQGEKGMRTTALVFASSNLNKIDYSLILNRRYRDATADARLLPVEGQVANGGWRTVRDAAHPINAGNPPTCAIVWDTPRPIRGFMMTEPEGWAGWAIDIWKGAPDAVIDVESVKDDANWQTVKRHSQERHHVKMNWHTNTVIHGDLGAVRDVRAFRVRMVEAPVRITETVGGNRAGFRQFLAFEPIGNDVELPATYASRITEVELPGKPDGNARVVRHVAIPAVGPLAVAADGTLFAVSRGAVNRVGDLAATPVELTPVIPAAQLDSPIAMTFDKAGLLYVLQGGRRQCIDVFDLATGKVVRTIGTPGGPKLGLFDPQTLATPSAIHIDGNDKLWIVEHDFQPKRITRWSLDGTLEKEFYGPTHYGGGGHIDPRDHSVVNYHGMKFRIDWKTYQWKLEARLFRDGLSSMNHYIPSRVFYVGDRRYLAADCAWTLFGDNGAVAAVCVERDGVAVPLAAAGTLGRWSAYQYDKTLQAQWGDFDAASAAFVWSDLNGDGKVQIPEVQVSRKLDFTYATLIGEDLSLNFRGWRLPVDHVNDDGVPIYDLASAVPRGGDERWTNARGETFAMGHTWYDADGVARWSYPDNYMSVQLSANAPGGFANRPPGVLVGGLRIVGHFQVGDEEFYAVNGNHGDWYAFTRDGLLAACIFGGPSGYGERYFNTPDYRPGQTDLSDLRTTVEDFYGCVVTAEDGHVYAVAGKNHLSMIRVDGLERLKRFSGTFTVGNGELTATREWVRQRDQMAQFLASPRDFGVAGRVKPPVIDGDVAEDWVEQRSQVIRETFDLKGKVVGTWAFSMSYDANALYLYASAHDEAQTMVNRAADWFLQQQGGDAVDFTIGVDAAADPARTLPAAGDQRLILAVDANGKPRTLLLRPVAPDAPADAHRVFTSPVGRVAMDDVRLLPDVRLAIRRGEKDWTLEAAIPWSSLGLKGPPPAGTRLRGDLGFLVSDDTGAHTADRFYWANRQHVVMGDLPEETRLNPAFWGTFVIQTLPNLLDTIPMDDLAPGGGKGLLDF